MHVTVKTVKSGVYENRLAEFCTIFDDHKKTVELAMSIHVSIGMDAANEKLDHQHDRLTNIERKLDMIALFRKLDTPREKDINRFIDIFWCVLSKIKSDRNLGSQSTTALANGATSTSSRTTGRDHDHSSSTYSTTGKLILS